MLCIYKLYIGLSQANCSNNIDRDQVVSAVASSINSFTEYDALVYFKGEQENALEFSIAHEDVSYHRITQNNESHIHKSKGLNLAFNSEARESLS